MKKRDQLLASVAKVIKDYRKGELDEPDSDHVDRWVRQFPEGLQVSILEEMNHVLRETYFSRETISEFFAAQIAHEDLAGPEPCKFWKRANLLNIQQNGNSQKEILALFDESLEEHCGFGLDGTGKGNDIYLYLDDAIFSGSRMGNDLEAWIKSSAPEKAVVHVLVIAAHRFGEWKSTDRLKKAAKSAKKDIAFHTWALIRFENRLRYKDASEILWPTEIPDNKDLKAYMEEEERFPFKPRKPGGKLKIDVFSSENGRHLLEQQFLLAGMKIRGLSKNPSPAMRPLGFSPFGLGFGALITTFRNCPNNCPLAMWWGDPDAEKGSPLSKWYPLMRRKTYEQDYGFGPIHF